MQETWVQSLGQEDAPEKAAHSSILAWEITWTEELGKLQSMEWEENLAGYSPWGCKTVRHDLAIKQYYFNIKLN